MLSTNFRIIVSRRYVIICFIKRAFVKSVSLDIWLHTFSENKWSEKVQRVSGSLIEVCPSGWAGSLSFSFLFFYSFFSFFIYLFYCNCFFLLHFYCLYSYLKLCIISSLRWSTASGNPRDNDVTSIWHAAQCILKLINWILMFF